MEAFVWIGIIILSVVVEALSVQLVSVWFAFGGLGGLITYSAGGEIWLQIVIALVVTVICLIISKPLVSKMKKRGGEVRTNADRNIGEHGIVTNIILPDSIEGRVKLMGNSWAAVSADNKTIEEGTKVVVEKIEGAKLVVSIIN